MPGAPTNGPAERAGAPVEVIVHPGSPPLAVWLGEIWRTRRIVQLLTLRSLKARYRQTLLGAGWAILQPLSLMLVFWAFFGTILQVPSTGVASYPVFAFTGLVFWQFFARAIGEASGAIVHSAHFVTKVYFPRIHLPMSALGVSMVDLCAALTCLAMLLALSGIVPDLRVLALVGIILLLMTVGAGTAFWLATLNVRYRDVGQLVPFLTQMLMFASPVIYPSTLVPEPVRLLYGLNPMVTVIEGARWALLHGPAPDATGVFLSVLLALTLLVSGLEILRRTEPFMSDLV